MEIYMLFLLEDEQPKGHNYFLKLKVNLQKIGKTRLLKKKQLKVKALKKITKIFSTYV